MGRVTARAGTVVVRDSDPIYYHVREEPRIHHLALVVTVNGRDADMPLRAPTSRWGGPVRFVYTITYTGNNIVYNVTIQDPFVPGSLLSCNGDRILNAGESAGVHRHGDGRGGAVRRRGDGGVLGRRRPAGHRRGSGALLRHGVGGQPPPPGRSISASEREAAR